MKPSSFPAPREPLSVAMAIIHREGCLLIARRKEMGPLGGRWEFPGGKVADGETIEACLIREVHEELDIRVEIIKPLSPVAHRYPDQTVLLHPYLCVLTAGTPKPLAAEEIQWAPIEALGAYSFPEANDAILAQLSAIFKQVTP